MPEENTQSVVRPAVPSFFYAPMRPEPTPGRLAAPSTLVIIQNTSEAQIHIVVDRFNVGHELRPGEKRQIEMLNDEIESFREQRKPGRLYPNIDPLRAGMPKPLHPILIVDVPPVQQTHDEQEEVAKRQRQR